MTCPFLPRDNNLPLFLQLSELHFLLSALFIDFNPGPPTNSELHRAETGLSYTCVCLISGTKSTYIWYRMASACVKNKWLPLTYAAAFFSRKSFLGGWLLHFTNRIKGTVGLLQRCL